MNVLVQAGQRAGRQTRAPGRGASARSAPKACGRSATAAARSSGRRIWKPTATSAPSAAPTSASTPSPASSSCSTATYEALRRPTSTPPIRWASSIRKPYRERLAAMQQATNLVRRADLRGRARSTGRRVQICAMDIRVHRRQHGLRGGREDHARHRALASRAHAADRSSPPPAARACRKARSA